MIDGASSQLLDGLQDWYRSNCNGDWEHEFAITIENIDNPGWSVSIPLAETSLEGKPFDPLNVQRAKDDWLLCRVEAQTFLGDGGPANLSEIIRIFLRWMHDASYG